jgi:hypothetical protein
VPCYQARLTFAPYSFIYLCVESQSTLNKFVELLLANSSQENEKEIRVVQNDRVV